MVAALVLNYVLANAAVARSFAPYLAALCNKNDNLDFFLVKSGGHNLDFMAFGLVLLLMLLLVWGIKETKSFNNSECQTKGLSAGLWVCPCLCIPALLCGHQGTFFLRVVLPALCCRPHWGRAFLSKGGCGAADSY